MKIRKQIQKEKNKSERQKCVFEDAFFFLNLSMPFRCRSDRHFPLTPGGLTDGYHGHGFWDQVNEEKKEKENFTSKELLVFKKRGILLF